MLSSSWRFKGSANTKLRSARRSSSPSAVNTPAPNAATTSAEPRLPRRYHAAGRFVRIYHRYFKFRKAPGYRGFAACNAAGKPDAEALGHDLVSKSRQVQVTVHQTLAIHHGQPTSGRQVGPERHGRGAVSAA